MTVAYLKPTLKNTDKSFPNGLSTLTRQRLKRGVFRSVDDLEQAIARYIREHNGDAKPFVWIKPANAILDKLSRLPEPSV